MVRVFHDMLIGPLIARRSGKKLVGGWVLIPNKDLALMKDLIEAGKVKPVIDRRYGLNEASDALRYLQQKHARGKVVVDPGK